MVWWHGIAWRGYIHLCCGYDLGLVLLGWKEIYEEANGRSEQDRILMFVFLLNSFLRNRALRTPRYGHLAWIRLYDCQFCVSTFFFPFAGLHGQWCCPSVLVTFLLTGNSTLIGNPATGAILSRYGSTGLLVFLALVLLTGLISAVLLRWCCLRGEGRGVVEES